MDGFEKLINAGKKAYEKGLERERNGEFPKIKSSVKESVERLNSEEKRKLLIMTMKSLRGSWCEYTDRLSLVFYLVETVKGFPKTFLDSIRHNAFQFDGKHIDGRVFRDGARTGGLTGNLCYSITGDDRETKKYNGTYNEGIKLLDDFWVDEKSTKKLAKILSRINDWDWVDECNEGESNEV